MGVIPTFGLKALGWAFRSPNLVERTSFTRNGWLGQKGKQAGGLKRG